MMHQFDIHKIDNPEQNMKELIKAASGYLALYEKELSFTPSGKFERDMNDLIHAVTQLLPDGQLLDVDCINNRLAFVVYQSSPTDYWDTIVYIPVSIAHTMRLEIRKLFIRFIAFIMQQNNLSNIKDTYDYAIYVRYIQDSLREKDEEVTESQIEALFSYKNKKGKAYQILKQIEQCQESYPDNLLEELKRLKHLSINETEQVQCMVRGLELLSRDKLSGYVYDKSRKNNCSGSSNVKSMRIGWDNLICVSWGTPANDALVEFHLDAVNDRCQNYDVTTPYSYMTLSSENPEKLAPCIFPFEWLDYICNDFYEHLAINE